MNTQANKVGVISNPRSGHNRDHFAALAQRLEQCPGIVHRVTDSAADIDPALRELSQAAPRTLAINGGDGTAAAVLGQLLEHRPYANPPRVLLLPAGTANMSAGDVGVRGSLSRAINKLRRWCEAGQPEPASVERRALMRVERDNEPPRYGMFLGAGAIVLGADYAHREIHSRGLRDDLSVALGTVRTVWGVFRNDPAFRAHLDVSVQVDGGETMRHDTLLLAVSTLHRLGFGMRPFWGEGEGRLRLTLVEESCTRFPGTFFSIARGRPNRNAVGESGYFSYNAGSIRLSLEGRLNLDGELLHNQGPVTITPSEDVEFIRL